MRRFLLFAVSLAGGVLVAGHASAQARSEGTTDSRSDESPGKNVPYPSPSQPFSRFDLNEFWALPGNKNLEKGLSKGELGSHSDTAGSPKGTANAPPAGAKQKSGPAEAEELEKALAPKPAPEAVRKELIDVFLERLRKASDPEDAQRIAETIERLWLQSYSDTANLLMQRAMSSMQAGQSPLALSLLDKLVLLEPDWAEAWNQRATARILSGDADGAMADLSHVTRLEPRHFLALAGMGMILEEAGLDKAALEIFNRVLALYPLEQNIRTRAGKLTLKVDGQHI